MLVPALYANVAALSGAASVAWSPASLGANLAVDFTKLDSSHLFQDTACTIPVTADGQTAKGYKDLATGVTFNNPTGWVYHANSGKPYLQMDGSSVWWTTANATFADAGGQFSIWFTAQLTTTAMQYLVSTNHGNLLTAQPGSVVTFYMQGTSATLGQDGTGGVLVNTDQVYSGIIKSSTLESYVDNVGDGASSWSGSPVLVSDIIYLNSPSVGRFYGMLIGLGDQTANRTSAQAFMAGLHP